MAFSDLIGQDFATGLVRNAYERDRFPHAYVISGPEKAGKFTFAWNIALALNCVTRKESEKKNGRRAVDFEPCGTCANCRSAEHGNFAELVIIEAPKDKRQINIEQIRDGIIARSAFKAREDVWQVFIIRDADAMNQQAANALLKTLEEPAPQTILLLTTAHPESLPNTVISRCQSLRVCPVQPEEIVKYLESRGIGGEDAAFIGKFAAGSIGRALAFHGDEFYAKRKWLFEKVSDMPKMHPVQLSGDIIKECQGSAQKGSTADALRMKLVALLDLLSSFFRDVLVCGLSSGGNDTALLNDDCRGAAEKLNLSTDSALDILDRITECRLNIEQNINYRIALVNLMLAINAVYRERR